MIRPCHAVFCDKCGTFLRIVPEPSTISSDSVTRTTVAPLEPHEDICAVCRLYSDKLTVYTTTKPIDKPWEKE
jgi:hypothetical protein